jgi:hypothetical protein
MLTREQFTEIVQSAKKDNRQLDADEMIDVVAYLNNLSLAVFGIHYGHAADPDDTPPARTSA